MTTSSAASLSDGNFHLLLGDDPGVSAEEISAPGRSIRLGPGELTAVAAVLDGSAVGRPGHGLLVITDDLNPEAGAHITVGAGGGELGALLRSTSEEKLALILTEAVARGWLHLLAWAESGPLAWSREDSESIGRLGIQGRPLLSEYLAERRRAVRGGGYTSARPAAIAAEDATAREVLCSLLAESGSRVQFGAAELAVAGDTELRTIVASATSEGDWLDNLRLALAVEEALAADLLLEVLSGSHGRSGPLERWTRLRAAIAARVLACRGRVPIFEEVLDRLRRAPDSVWNQVFRRGRIKNARYVGDDVSAYLGMFAEPDLSAAPDPDQARRLVDDLQTVAAGGKTDGALIWVDPVDLGDGPEPGAGQPPGIGELAGALGEGFSRRTAHIEEQIGQLREAYPGEDAEGLGIRVRRMAAAELDAVDATEEDSEEIVSRVILDLVLAYGLLHGVPVEQDSEREELGTAVLEVLGWSVAVRRGTEATGPLPQVLLVDHLLRQMSRIRPTAPGTYRKLYQVARSRVERVRRGGRERAGTVHGADDGARVPLDRTASRLLLNGLEHRVRRLAG